MTKKSTSAHRPFTWVGDHVDQHKSEFIEITYDVARGIVMALDMILISDLEEQAMENGSDCTPILDPQDREIMLLFAKSAAKLLHMQADTEINFLNSLTAKKGAKA